MFYKTVKLQLWGSLLDRNSLYHWAYLFAFLWDMLLHYFCNYYLLLQNLKYPYQSKDEQRSGSLKKADNPGAGLLNNA